MTRNFRRRDGGAKKAPRPIDKHGAYDGTDVGFTSTSVENPRPVQKRKARGEAPIDRAGNYDGTDAGFTSDGDQ